MYKQVGSITLITLILEPIWRRLLTQRIVTVFFGTANMQKNLAHIASAAVAQWLRASNKFRQI